MPTNPNVNYITGFSEIVYHEFQQMTSKLFPYVTLTEMKGDKKSVEGMGGVKAKKINARFQPVIFNEIEHLRRKLPRNRYSVDLPIDANDTRAMTIDQQTEYAKAIVAALQREVDREIYTAMFATVYTGEDFETPVTYLNDGVVQIDATAGLTYEQMLEIKKSFIDKDVDVDNNEFVFIGTGGEDEALMKEVELTSGDFTRQYAVEKGFMVRALMFDLKWFAGDPDIDEPIIQLNGSGERRCAAMVKGGVIMGIGKQVMLEVKDRPDLHETKQVSAIISIGAVRRQGNVIREVLTTP